MYTNPFSRTHSSVRQVIDWFLHMNDKKNSSKSELKRNGSDSSVYSSSWSVSSHNSSRISNSCQIECACRRVSVSKNMQYLEEA
ncbi:hypothetical protein NQ318_018055 [Aromia moschata]|uniref:Uncharacterized protein n=1 Tax=Aromia moschata TaxID=1265417 RepID=A0AAV8ZD08_9CUCU|nr:hypothetical protein NQ318_018055 [Aromia moschata]